MYIANVNLIVYNVRDLEPPHCLETYQNWKGSSFGYHTIIARWNFSMSLQISIQ